MTRFSLSRILMIALTIHMVGCASTPESGNDPATVEGPVYYTIKQDDRLGDIAYAITGSTDNWVVIAEHNNVEDARKIRVGDVIEIPLSLIRDNRAKPESDGSVLAINTVGTRKTESAQTENASAGPGLTQTANNSSGRTSNNEDVDVVLKPVNINRQFQLTEMDIDVNSDAVTAGTSAKIRVVGTYFPKGIYEEPTAAARLITRVAPGTVFDLVADLDGWYRIQFEDGVAYLRAIDGKIFFPDKPEILRSAEANE